MKKGSNALVKQDGNDVLTRFENMWLVWREGQKAHSKACAEQRCEITFSLNALLSKKNACLERNIDNLPDTESAVLNNWFTAYFISAQRPSGKRLFLKY
ncbi:hypothetical protein L596_000104 [Steinernema carpocapsae]|uniref:Uncharacterized protein n=1 Tax=Steinernema carpocapsae TaxID=34508 RepID=A0A4U8UJ99_STECR|nr:hypothetical protein L596_000104 [Steinernema carpocapsae]